MGSRGSHDVEAVSFDLDDTLVAYERSPGEVLDAAFDRVDCDPLFAVEEYYARYDEFAEQCDSMDELRAECFAALARENGYEGDQGRAVAAAFSEERDQSRVRLLPGAERVLEALSRDHALGIVTNGAADAQRRKLEAVALDRWVDAVVIASHDTPPKPDPEPFAAVMDALESTPDTTVHVGDSLETDIAGATAAGLDSVWVSEPGDAGQFDPTYRVSSLDELRPLPWRSGSGPGQD